MKKGTESSEMYNGFVFEASSRRVLFHLYCQRALEDAECCHPKDQMTTMLMETMALEPMKFKLR